MGGLCAATVEVSLLGILQYVSGKAELKWVDVTRFGDIGGRVCGVFENPNVFAEYLLILVPLAFLYLLEQNTKSGKVFGVVLLAVLTLCTINTWSRGAWLGLGVATVVYWLIADKRSPVYLLGGLLLAPTATFMLPDSISERLLSIGNFGDSSVAYRFSVWKGVWRMLRETLWCGVGVGHAAFSAVYPAFAYGGSIGIRHAHSIYLQLIAELGIIGFFIVAAVLFLFVQTCFEYFLKVSDQKKKRLPAVVFSSVLGMLIMGLTDHIWYDYRIFFCFWVVIALVSAYVRRGFLEEERRFVFCENTAEQASVALGGNDWGGERDR